MPGNQLPQEIYRLLCALLSRPDQTLGWEAFSQVDWLLLAQKARSEGVAPLAYGKLRQAPPHLAIQQAALENLRQETYQTAAGNALLFQELSGLLQSFSAAGIPAIVLKGAVLASALYPDPALRPMGDLDLLVREDHLDRAAAIVEASGYQMEGALRGLSPDLRRRIHCEVNYQGGAQIPVHLEIHWGLIGGQASRYAPDMAWFWQQTEPWVLPGQTQIENIFALKPTAHLLYLMAHLILKHGSGLGSLRWYYDVHLLVERWGAEIDWQTLLGKARVFHWEAALPPALLGCIERFGTPVPPAVVEVLRAIPADRREKAGRAPKSDLGRTLDELGDLAWGARLRLILALIFPSRETIRWRYQPQPGWIWPLCYPYRWAILLKAVGVEVFEKLR